MIHAIGMDERMSKRIFRISMKKERDRRRAESGPFMGKTPPKFTFGAGMGCAPYSAQKARRKARANFRWYRA